MAAAALTPGAMLEIDRRIAQTEVMKALVLLLALHETADGVQLRATMIDGTLTGFDVAYTMKGRTLGGFGS